MTDIATLERLRLERLVARLRYVLWAERVTRILCRRSGDVAGYRWRQPPKSWTDQTRLTSHRSPPLPFHQGMSRPGHCRVCGQPIYAAGSYRPFLKPNARLTWHDVCLSTYTMMTKPAEMTEIFCLRQNGRCAVTGVALPHASSSADMDHTVPLFRVAQLHADEPWYDLIRFWGSGNLRAISHAAHKAKCADEAAERAGRKVAPAGQAALL